MPQTIDRDPHIRAEPLGWERSISGDRVTRSWKCLLPRVRRQFSKYPGTYGHVH